MRIRYKQIASLMGLNTINAALGIFYSYLMMYHYGTSVVAKIFFAASLMNQSVVKISQSGNLLEFIIPMYFQEKIQRGDRAADRVFSISINNIALVSFFIVAIALFSVEVLIDVFFPGFSTIDQVMIKNTFILISVLTIFQVLNGMFQGLLLAKKRFGRAELTNSVSVIFSIVVLLTIADSNSINPLIIAAFISTAIQSVSIFWALYASDYKHFWVLNSPYFTTRQLFKNLSTTSVYVLSVQIYTALFNAALSFLPGNIFTIYRYSEMIWNRVSSLIMTPFNTIFFSDFSQLLTESSDIEKVKKYLLDNISIIIILSLFVFLFFYAGTFPLFWLLFKSKNMSFEDVTLLFSIVVVFIGTLLLTSLQSVYRKVVSAAMLADKQYLFYSVFHVLSAGISYFLITKLYFWGMIAAIIIHSFLMLIASIMVLLIFRRNLLLFVSKSELIRIITANVAVFLMLSISKNQLPSFEHSGPMSLLLYSGILTLEFIVFILVFYHIFRITYLNNVLSLVVSKLKTKWQHRA